MQDDAKLLPLHNQFGEIHAQHHAHNLNPSSRIDDLTPEVECRGFLLPILQQKASRDPVTVRKEVLRMNKSKLVDGKEYKLIFRRYYRKNGRTIYPKHSKVFPLWIPA